MDLFDGTAHICHQSVKWHGGCQVFSTDQNVIPAVLTQFRQDQPSYLSQSTFCTIASNRIAYLLGTGKANTDTRRLTLSALAALKVYARASLATRI